MIFNCSLVMLQIVKHNASADELLSEEPSFANAGGSGTERLRSRWDLYEIASRLGSLSPACRGF
jgi:hypothetical protein